jgi:hypothetical protein
MRAIGIAGISYKVKAVCCYLSGACAVFTFKQYSVFAILFVPSSAAKKGKRSRHGSHSANIFESLLLCGKIFIIW